MLSKLRKRKMQIPDGFTQTWANGDTKQGNNRQNQSQANPWIWTSELRLPEQKEEGVQSVEGPLDSEGITS